MFPPRRAASVAVVALAAAVLAWQAPAAAHHKPGHQGGPGSSCEQTASKPYPPKPCRDERVGVDDDTLERGQTFTVTAQEFQPGAPVVVTMLPAQVEVGAGTADAFGFADIVAVVPVAAPVGRTPLTATGQGAGGGTLVLTVPVTVVPVAGAGAGGAEAGDGDGAGGAGQAGPRARASAVPGVRLPRTGVEILLAACAGAGLIASGGALVRTGRRRQAADLAR